MTQTILLTGITGFIAKRIAADLLNKGYAVRGSLRSMDRADDVRTAIGDHPNLSFVELDLTRDTGWDSAMAGADVLMHTASPFPLSQPDDENDIIRPAVDGTLRALKAAHKAGISRVILTASIVSVMHSDKAPQAPHGPNDWSDVTHPTANAYVKSKTLAEKVAWDFVATHPEMQMTTIHPGLVCGTPVDRNWGTSLKVINRILAAKDPMQPAIPLPITDIQDVSDLHIAALETPDSIGQRVLVADKVMTFPEVAAVLATAHPDRNIKTATAPKILLRVLSLFDASLRGVLAQVGWKVEIDNSATERLFSYQFTPAETSIKRSAAAILAAKSTGT